jgi:hypothetical protein
MIYIIRRANERIRIHEQKTEICVFERRLIVCVSKIDVKKERKGQTQKKRECTKKIPTDIISVEMDLVVVVAVTEKKIVMFSLTSYLMVFVLDLVLNLFVLYKLGVAALKNLLLVVLRVYVMTVDFVLVVAL